MRPTNTQKRRSNQGGFTMIEVLIAMVYMTVGLLGIIAMEDVALSRNVDAKRITIATNLATEMIDRIRLNSPANINPLLTAPFAPLYLYNGIVACAPVVAPNCAAAGVTQNGGNTAGVPPPNASAWGDYLQWTDHFAVTDANGVVLLPNGVGRVSSTVIGAPVLGQVLIAVTVAWSSGFRTPSLTMSTIVAPL
ncbi:MAG TPA: type IV pilus modification protein PilV [Nitrospirales bacterium]